MGSKSVRTQYRYHELLADQKTLDAFGFSMSTLSSTSPNFQHSMAYQPPSADIPSPPIPSELSITPSTVKAEEPATPLRANDTSTWKATPGRIHEESLTPPPLSFSDPDHSSQMVRVREESMTPPRIFFDDKRSSPIPIREESIIPSLLFDYPVGSTQKRPRSTSDGEGSEDELDEDVGDNEEEPWEAEASEMLTAQVEIRGWKELRDQIKKDLKTKHATLPLSHLW